MFIAKAYKVMVGAPSDIKDEVAMTFDAIYEWNNAYAKVHHIVLLPCHWEKSTYPTVGERPQESINKQMVNDSDMMVAIFGGRLGSATGGFPSGSIEEIERHRKSGKHVMVFFRSNVSNPDPNEYKRLCEYKQQHKDDVYWVTYKDESEYIRVFNQKLSLFLADTWLNSEYESPENKDNEVEVDFYISKSQLEVDRGDNKQIEIIGISLSYCDLKTDNSDIAYATREDGKISIHGEKVGETLLRVSYKDKEQLCKIKVVPLSSFCGNPILDFEMSLGDLVKTYNGNLKDIGNGVFIVDEESAKHAYYFEEGRLQSIMTVIPTSNLSYYDCYSDSYASMSERYRSLQTNSDGQWYSHGDFYVLSINAYEKGAWIFIYSPSKERIKMHVKKWKGY